MPRRARPTPGFDPQPPAADNRRGMMTQPDAPRPPAGGRSQRPVAVVTDAATALPLDVARAHSVFVAPMAVTIQGVTYDGRSHPDLERFYRELLPGAGEPPTTTAPRPADWLEQFRAASAQGRSIFCVTVSSTLSIAYDSARVAAELAVDELPGSQVTVFDSKTAAGSEALVALAAARAAGAGGDIDAVARAAAHARDRVRLVAFLDTLEYVWRSGRIPRVAFWAGSVLGIRPVIEYQNGRPALVAHPRSRARATDRLLVEMRSDVGGRRTHAVVIHAGVPDEAEALRDRVGSEFDCAELIVTPFPAFMGTHTGPGLLGLAYWPEPD